MINIQHIILFHHFRRFLDAAAKEQIDVAPLKGAELITSVYPADEDRGPLADVDFLVRPRDWTRVQSLLVELGFSRGEYPDRPVTADEFYEACYFLQINDGLRILFEPHRALIQPSRHPIDYDALWRRSRPAEFEGAPCRRLAAEDHFLYAVIHEMTHRFRSLKKTLRDLELLARRGNVNFELVVLRASRWQCRTATWLVLELLHKRAPDLGAGLATSRLAPPAPVRKMLRWLVPGEEGPRMRHHNLGLRAEQALLWPWLLDSPLQVARFGASYVKLRARDFAAARREAADTE